MPHIKNALIRYRVIDKMIGGKFNQYPSKVDLRRRCEEELYGDANGNHISASTIEKDLFAMREEMDAPIAYSVKHRGYYYEEQGFSINKQPFSEDDRASIQFALSTLAQFKETPLFQQFGSELSRVMNQVKVNFDDADRTTPSFIQFEKRLATKGDEYLQPLIQAIKNGNIVYFSYESFVSQVKKQRKVTPLLLKEYDGRWYLISYDLVKEKVITYALDRISDLDCTENKGEKPHQFNPDRYFKYSVGITASDNSLPEHIVFKATTVAAKYILSQPFHESIEVLEEDESAVLIQLNAMVSEELIRVLLSYAGELTVIEPQTLRKELIKRANDLLNRYE